MTGFVDKEWFCSMIRLFNAVASLVCLEMEKGFCKIMLYHMMYNMLNTMKAFT